MEKKIPLYFDTVVVESPFQGISQENPKMGRLKVRVFSKYGNRNGSYITEAVANELIDSAVQGMTPVVGFFDPETKSWASHTGPKLANGYGYVENFLGWEPFQDTDGVTRDYAVFSVILFTDYFEEANLIFGQNQSMELNPDSITGDWAEIEGQEYYVYKTAKMLGFCVIGQHEPCFSVSSFFSKNDDTYKNQYEKFSSLLFDLKAKVEEAENNNKGGEQAMEDLKTAVNDDAVIQLEDELKDAFQQKEGQPTPAAEPTVEFETLQKQFNELQESFNALQSNYESAQSRIAELEQFQSSANTELETLRSTNEELQTSISAYEAKVKQYEENRKMELVGKYEKVMSEEEITPIRDNVTSFSYDELESKLAIAYANKTMASGEQFKKVPLPDAPESQFAILMQKYRK